MPEPTAKSTVLLRIGVVLAVLGAAIFVGLKVLRPTAVVATVQRGVAADVVTGSVVVHADKDLQQIKSELPGRVAWIDPRQLGESFKAGEAIVKLDSSDLEREIKQAEADFNVVVERLKIQQQNDSRLLEAKDRLAYAKLQHQRGHISDADLKNAERAMQLVETNLALEQFDAKQARVTFENRQAALRRQLEKMTIRAPMDGICQAVMVAPGALIGEGTTVATYFSNQRVVIAKVGEEDVGRVRPGLPARVRLLNTSGEAFEAKVTTILPFADAETQRYSVYLEVKADPTQLKPFSTGEATITVGERANQPLIPRRALMSDDYVFVVKDGRVEKRKVTLGFKALNYAEVTGKLTEGEQVIVEDLDQFRDGQRVRIADAQ